MPESKLERIVFSALMAVVMVYGMIVYNIAIELGEISSQVFVQALPELIIMVPIAFVLEGLFVEKLAIRLAFKFVSLNQQKIIIIIVIQTMIVLIMCPIMSLVATLLFTSSGPQFFSVWIQKYAINLPFALGYQLIICGPFVRKIISFVPSKLLV